MASIQIKRLEKPRTKLSLEEQVKAYKPKKVKILTTKEKPKNKEFGENLVATHNLKAQEGSIQELLNDCHSDVKTLIDGKVSTYIAKPNCLILILNNKMKVKVEYGQQYKTPGGKLKSKHLNIRYTVLDSHNRVIA